MVRKTNLDDDWDYYYSPRYLGAAHNVTDSDNETKSILAANIYLPPRPGERIWSLRPIYREDKKVKAATGFRAKR